MGCSLGGSQRVGHEWKTEHVHMGPYIYQNIFSHCFSSLTVYLWRYCMERSQYIAQLMVGSRQEYWSGLPFPSPEELPDPGIEPGSPAL